VKRVLGLLTVTLLTLSLCATADGAAHSKRHSRPVELVWYVETIDGQPVESRQGDEAINPASVVKVATSLWALERLGPDFRFETRLFARGSVDREHRTLRGDLIVQGSGDPDFHVENAFLVAQALNDVGVERVTGAVIVNQRFWMGWENGSAGREPDPVKRGILMATRLRLALDPKLWNRATRATWREFAERRGLPVSHPPRVAVLGGAGTDGDANRGEMLVVHRSQSLAEILRRFNCYSNNDIERVAADLGPTQELVNLLVARCDAPPDVVQLETASGLGSNRLTPRLIVRLLREFRQTCQRLGVPLESVLPVAGCDPGTVTHFFPLLANGPNTTSVIGKTGTLTNTDGGVAVLAGYVRTSRGDFVFCVAAPNAAGKLKSSRRAEEQWVLDFLGRNGGGQPHACATPLPTPDAGANIILLGDHVIPPLQAPALPKPPVTAPVN
jgi:D-alanyl-D-alanine carboxypeptidase/D-alanyl-D-alanine-endopeptidase (penicillin-binding protein 4)